MKNTSVTINIIIKIAVCLIISKFCFALINFSAKGISSNTHRIAQIILNKVIHSF